MWDNLLLYPCFEWLCFLSRVFIRGQVGGAGRGGAGRWAGLFDLSVSMAGVKVRGGRGTGVNSKLSQLVYTKSVFIKGVDRTGSVLFETGTFFCTKVIIKAQLLLLQGTTDG